MLDRFYPHLTRVSGLRHFVIAVASMFSSNRDRVYLERMRPRELDELGLRRTYNGSLVPLGHSGTTDKLRGHAASLYD